MPTITHLQPDQTAEARRTIYATAHALFRDFSTLEETIAHYEQTWPLMDIADYQHSYVENGGVFLVMCEQDRIIGTGALRRLKPEDFAAGVPAEMIDSIKDICEIKRLWLLPEYQGRGLGYQMMTRLLAAAREKGYKKVRLETSPQYQAKAFAFYLRLGFYVIPRYGSDPDDVGMEMVLS